jgi:polar amino acid transport system permease protein
MGSFDWHYTIGLFGDADLWRAALLVVELAVSAWAIATALGLLVALAQQSRLRPLRLLAGAYVWFFRSLPLLVLLIFVYNSPQLLPGLRPFLSSPFAAGLVALVLSETAYTAEIHRGGLLAVGKDQGEAAQALGIPYAGVQRHVVVPQAFRVALPALGNEFISILKLTSLVSSISLAELLLVGQRLYTQNFLVLETLLAVAVYYVLLVTLFDRLRALLERRLDVRKRRTKAAVGDMPEAEVLTAPRRTRPRVPHEGEAVVRARGLRKSFGAVSVLNGVDLDVHRGEVVAVIGPSGSGKTTLVRTLNHLEQPDDGSVEIDGRPMGGRDRQLAAQRRRVGMVFQRFNLFPHRTALQNITLAPLQQRLHDGRSAAESRARELLRKVGMDAHAHKYPHQLSGGQQQRVAIARALAMEPSVLLFDEPTSALDPELVGEVLSVMSELAADGTTMVVVTHEMRFARQIADWVVFMDQGRVLVQGPPEAVFDNSGEPRLERFVAAIDPA